MIHLKYIVCSCLCIDVGDEHAVLQELEACSRAHGQKPNRSSKGRRYQ